MTMELKPLDLRTAISSILGNPFVFGVKYEVIEIPEGVEVEVNGKKVRVKGPKGEVEKDFSHVKTVEILKLDNKIVVISPYRKDKDTKPLRTVASKIRNMIEGVQRWFIYKHRVVFAHFPIRVRVEENERGRFIVLENFYGRRDPIKVPIIGEQTQVEVILEPGSDIPSEVIIKGPDKDAVSQTSANLHEACKLRGKFRKDPRVFQDGVWRYMVTREGEE